MRLHVMQDTRYALRQMSRHLVVTVIVTTCLGAAIGVTTVVFQTINGLLLQGPVGVWNESDLRRLYFPPREDDGSNTLAAKISYPLFEDIRSSTRAFADVGAYWVTDLSVGAGADAQLMRGALVSPSFFQTIGVPASRGRVFTATGQGGEEGSAVVISHALRTSLFDDDVEPIGKPLVIGGRTFPIMGVLPRAFTGVDAAPVDLWLHVAQMDNVGFSRDLLFYRAASWVSVVGRLRHDVSDSTAIGELSRILGAVGEGPAGGRHPDLGPLNEAAGTYRHQGATVGRWVALLTAVILLVACANVASVLMARALARRREIAIRVAIGATRGRVARQLLTECILLTTIGGVVGLGVLAALRQMLVLIPSLPPLPPNDWGTLAFVAGLCGITGVVFGMAPALQAMAVNSDQLLRASAATDNRATTVLRDYLVIGQVALAVMLLTGAGLFVSTFAELARTELGFRADGLIIVTPHLPPQNARSGVDLTRLVRISEAVAAVPGISRTSVVSSAPLGARTTIPVSVAATPQRGPAQGDALFMVVDEEYFATLDVPIQNGRGFVVTDDAKAPRVAVVNGAFVARYGNGATLVGECVSFPSGGDQCVRVVGIARTFKMTSVREEAMPTLFVPARQRHAGVVTVVLARSRRGHGVSPPALQQTLQEGFPSFGYIDVQPAPDLVNSQMARWRIGAGIFTVYGAVSLLLIVAGVYGLLSFAVTQRQRDLGVRLAFGAEQRDIMALVMRWAATRLATGLVIGGGLAILLARGLASQVEGVHPLTGGLLAAVMAVLLVCGMVAAWIPARRASRLDPVAALKVN